MHPWRNWIAHQIPILTVGGSNPFGCTIKAHAKGAYKTPLRVSFSMQKRKNAVLWQFTLFVVPSRIVV